MNIKRIRILFFGLLFILVASSFFLVAEMVRCSEIEGYVCKNETKECEASRNQRCIITCIEGEPKDCDADPI